MEQMIAEFLLSQIKYGNKQVTKYVKDHKKYFHLENRRFVLELRTLGTFRRDVTYDVI